MTISLDTNVSAGENNSGMNSQGEFDDCSCGDTLDWMQGVERLQRATDQTHDVSGLLLTRVIEREIIPRLFLAHIGRTNNSPRVDEPTRNVITEAESDAFADLVLSSELVGIMEQVQLLIDRGVSLPRIYLDLLAPVAKRLGEYWEADRCSFTDVTLGLARLQQVLREVGRRSNTRDRQNTAKRRVCLVPAPGEQHTFGLSMVEEYFLHAGWETAFDQAPTAASIIHTVSTQKLDLIGFSVAYEDNFDPLMKLIGSVRKSALNPDMAIMVGGKFIADHPEIASEETGITFIPNGVTAVDTAEFLISKPNAIGPHKFT